MEQVQVSPTLEPRWEKQVPTEWSSRRSGTPLQSAVGKVVTVKRVPATQGPLTSMRWETSVLSG